MSPLSWFICCLGPFFFAGLFSGGFFSDFFLSGGIIAGHSGKITVEGGAESSLSSTFFLREACSLN
jgi:hypothetical protein